VTDYTVSLAALRDALEIVGRKYHSLGLGGVSTQEARPHGLTSHKLRPISKFQTLKSSNRITNVSRQPFRSQGLVHCYQIRVLIDRFTKDIRMNDLLP
jgi:hypothetical protein